MRGRGLGPSLPAVLVGLLSVLLLGGVNGPGGATVARADVAAPAFRGQFIAKMYTEALGRAPTQAEWQGWLDYFQDPAHPCSTAVLEEIVRGF